MMKIRAMRVDDVETVARMNALDHDHDPKKGYKEAKEHTLDHLKIVPETCYVVADNKGNIIAAMLLHPQKKYSNLKISM